MTTKPVLKPVCDGHLLSISTHFYAIVEAIFTRFQTKTDQCCRRLTSFQDRRYGGYPAEASEELPETEDGEMRLKQVRQVAE